VSFEHWEELCDRLGSTGITDPSRGSGELVRLIWELSTGCCCSIMRRRTSKVHRYRSNRSRGRLTSLADSQGGRSHCAVGD